MVTQHLQDVGDLDAQLVLAVEDFQSLPALWNQTITVNQHTIDVKGKGHVLSLLDLLRFDGLDLSSQQSTSWLDWWHARAGGSAGIVSIRVVNR